MPLRILPGALVLLFAASGAAAMAQGLSLPQHRGGYWEVTGTSNTAPSPTTKLVCQEVAPVVGRPPDCSSYRVTKTSHAWVVDMDCRSPKGAHLIEHSVVTGDPAWNYRVAMNIQVDGAADPSRDGRHSFALTFVYKGVCPSP